jgi:hypothetical protein
VSKVGLKVLNKPKADCGFNFSSLRLDNELLSALILGQ